MTFNLSMAMKKNTQIWDFFVSLNIVLNKLHVLKMHINGENKDMKLSVM